MRAELLQLAADLAKKGEPFVLAMVVRRESYSSAQQGDMAVITAGGEYHGWLGGNCTQPTVKREAQAALGPKFDIREFHAQVLGSGALPLTILEAKIDRWIAAKKAS